MAQISINMDDALMADGEAVLGRIGLNMTSAVTLFIKQVVYNDRLPFQASVESPAVTIATPEDKRGAILDFSELAANCQFIEPGYKFNRDECYDE